MIRGERVLLTGGAGFVGVNLAERLLPENEVVVLDNLHRNALLTEEGISSHPGLKFIQGDVLSEESVREATKGCTIVIHLAAIAGVDTVLKMPVRTMEVALLGTINCIRAAHAQKVKRFVDFSTSEVFGTYAFQVQEGQATSLGPVGEARWTYAVSKLATEHLTMSYYREKGLPGVCVRPFNIYGPRQVGEGAIHTFIVRSLRNEPLEIHNDGSQIRAWCYIDDMVDAVMLCLEKPEAVGYVFNIGNPRSVLTIYHLAQEIVRISGSRSEIKFVQWKQQDVELRVPNIDRARRLLGFVPKVDLEPGLERTIAWYRDRRGAGDSKR
ncbi:MAG: NAD-dependent epimerase/dehydratase family protein [Planctomycetota bacterium]|nr:NAD-dependent epimerase/dehydratase family protein [Planctomycetota bacterium]